VTDILFSMTLPITVLITGAAGQIGYCLVQSVASGNVFGPNQPVNLHLLDIAPMVPSLSGLIMELEDCAFPQLKSAIATSDLKEAFTDIDFALMVGAMPRKEGMERKDLLKANVNIFKTQGEALNQFAKKTVKVCVVGNPANTNCLIMSKYAPSIPKENFSALTRLDHNRAQAQIALKAGVSCDHVKRCVIWGNHSNTQYPDIHQCLVKGHDGKEISAKEAIKDDAWLNNEFIKTVQTRGAAVIAARKLSSALSASKAISDHCRDWFHGTKEWVSMAVYSDGSYDVPKDLIFSFPVLIENGKWHIVQGLTINDFSREKLELTAKELIEEREQALAFCN